MPLALVDIVKARLRGACVVPMGELTLLQRDEHLIKFGGVLFLEDGWIAQGATSCWESWTGINGPSEGTKPEQRGGQATHNHIFLYVCHSL